MKKIIVVLVGSWGIMAAGCGSSAQKNVDPVVWEEPDTVYRTWDEVKDDDYYKIPEEGRFMVENADGSIFIYGMNEDGKSVALYGGNPNGVERLEIPGKVEFSGKQYGVTRIGTHAFATFFNDSIKWMEGVKEISVDEGIESIGLGCFEGAPNVERINLPASLMNIGYAAMSDCEELEKVEIAKDSKLMVIEDFAFMNCLRLKGFTIPASVKSIRQGAWRNCKALPSFSLEDGNENFKVADGVLYSISGRQLMQYPAGKRNKDYAVEAGTMEIDNSAFYGNEYIESVWFPNSLKSIQHLAFAGCRKLKEVKFNSGLRWIGNSAFEDCESLKEVKLPGNTEYTQGNDYGYNTFPKWTKLNH